MSHRGLAFAGVDGKVTSMVGRRIVSMSKFLIVSDIHGDRAILVDILKQWHHQVDGVFIMVILSCQQLMMSFTAYQP